jgi:hypothetical protein
MNELFTKEIEKKLKKQFNKGFKIKDLEVITKIFNPYGLGTWYILSQNPKKEDELFAIVDWFELEIGFVSKEEISSIKVPPFELPLERDKYFENINAEVLLSQIRGARAVSTSNFEDGGVIGLQDANKPTFSPAMVFVGYNKTPSSTLILE